MYPFGAKIELFARENNIEKWDAWGNQASEGDFS